MAKQPPLLVYWGMEVSPAKSSNTKEEIMQDISVISEEEPEYRVVAMDSEKRLRVCPKCYFGFFALRDIRNVQRPQRQRSLDCLG